jgi:hypothetical protein
VDVGRDKAALGPSLELQAPGSLGVLDCARLGQIISYMMVGEDDV